MTGSAAGATAPSPIRISIRGLISHNGRPNQARICSTFTTSEVIVASASSAAARARISPAITSVSNAASSCGPAGVHAFALIPKRVWVPAYDADRDIRDGAWVAELTGLLPLIGWPVGMRVIARKERPHPGAKLRITDTDGMRVTAFATNTTVMDVMPTSA